MPSPESTSGRSGPTSPPLRRRRPSAEVMAVVKADAYGHGLVPVGASGGRGRRDLARHRAARRGARAARRRADRSRASWPGCSGPGDAVGGGAAGRRRPVGQRRVGAGRGRRRGPGDRVDRPGCTSRSTPAWAVAGAPVADWPDLVVAAPQGRRPRAPSRVVGRLVAPRVRRRARAPDDRRGRSTCSARRSRCAEARGHRPGGAPPGQLGRHADRARTQHFDLVRPGIAVYGLSPVPDVAGAGALGLRPAMTLAARPGRSSSGCRPGSGVSLRAPYTTDRGDHARARPARVRRRRSRATPTNVGPVLAAGRRRTVAGRVCMDQFVARRRRRPGRGRRRGGAVRAGRRRRADGAGLGATRPARSPTRSSPGSVRGCRGTYAAR